MSEGVCDYHHCNRVAAYEYQMVNEYGRSETVVYCEHHAATHAEEGTNHHGRTPVNDE
jgi:hypothetical protein